MASARAPPLATGRRGRGALRALLILAAMLGGGEAEPPPPPPCHVLAFLHVPKCAGTSVRQYFKERGWYVTHHCTTLREVGLAWASNNSRHFGSLQAHRKYVIEVHCKPHLPQFVAELGRVRALAEARGCRFGAATVLREPGAMAVSDSEYFSKQRARRNMTREQWLRANRELLLIRSNTHLRLDLLPELAARLERARRAEYGAGGRAPAPADLPRLERARAALARAEGEVSALGARKDARRKVLEPDRLLRAQQRADAAHSDWLAELQAARVLRCAEDVAAPAARLLAQLDVVGTVDRLADAVALMLRSVGLDMPPRRLGLMRSNVRPVAFLESASQRAALGRRVGAELNACSQVVYAHAAARFDEAVRLMHARPTRPSHVVV